MAILSDAQWFQYFTEGYLRLGKVLDDSSLTALQRRIDDIMLGKVRNEKLMMQLDKGGDYSNMAEMTVGFKGPTLEYRKIENLEFDPLFLAYLQKPVFRELCADIYGAHAGVSVWRSMFMNKPARKGTLLPWHQDGGESWGLDRDPLLTVWTALDPATVANGCVQVIPGSHRLGLLSKKGHVISEAHVEQYCAPEKTVFLELKAGEVVILHNFLLHRSDVNNSDIARRGFSVNYMDARTKRVKTGLKESAHLTFPVVFGENALTVEGVKQYSVAQEPVAV